MAHRPYRIVEIRKKSGKYRTIYVFQPSVRRYFSRLVPRMCVHALALDRYRVAHGFMPGRSPVTNALAHVGPHEMTLTLDIEDFFHSLAYGLPAGSVGCRASKYAELAGRVQNFLANPHLLGRDAAPPMVRHAMRLLYEMPAPQGLPTSPVAANILTSVLDATVHEFASSVGCVYTRYADDMAISGPEGSVEEVAAMCMEELNFYALRVAHEKTRRYYASRGLRMITGIGVSDSGIRAPRRVRRRLRAALHAGCVSQAAGLAEWTKLKLPRKTRWLMRSIERGHDPVQIARVLALL